MVKKLESLTAEEQKLIENQKVEWMKRHRMSEEDYAKFLSIPAHIKLTLRTEEMRKYKAIAEVVRVKYCNAGLKVGQKFTFRVMPSKLLVEESDCPLCIKALGPMGQIMLSIWDRLLEGTDPNESMWTHYQCLDSGVDQGGLGNVLFKVYTVKAD